MSLPGSYSFAIQRGASVERKFTRKYRDTDLPTDLTGYKARCQIRTFAGRSGTSTAGSLLLDLADGEGIAVTDAAGGQAGSFAAFAQWVVLNERDGRLLVDGIGSKADINVVLGMLQQIGREPKVIGAWHPDGGRVAAYPFDLAAWLEVAPDELDTTDPENPVANRPDSFSEIHAWAGWAPKQIQ